MIFKQRTMKNIKILIFLSIFSLVTYFWFSNKDNFLMSNIDSKQGIYEFTEWNEDELYRLKGEWEFYPNNLLMKIKVISTVNNTRLLNIYGLKIQTLIMVSVMQVIA